MTLSHSPSDSHAPSTTRVLVVDDHPAVLDALSATIDREHDLVVCGSTTSATEAMRLVPELQPDVATVDIALQDAHGLDLVHNLRTQYRDLRVIVFSMYDESVYAERAIRAGAYGYVMKSEPTQTVIAAIRAAARDEVYLSRRMASRMLSKLANKGNGASPGFAIDALTDREMAVFQMLGQGTSVQDIADQLNLSRKTVETYRRRAKEKLELGSLSELLRFATQWIQEQARSKRTTTPPRGEAQSGPGVSLPSSQ